MGVSGKAPIFRSRLHQDTRLRNTPGCNMMIII